MPKVVFTSPNSGGGVRTWDTDSNKVDVLYDEPCTGLTRYKDSFLAITQHPTQPIVVDAFTGKTREFTISPPQDPHDMWSFNRLLYVVSTTENGIRSYTIGNGQLNPLGLVEIFPKVEKGEDAIHLNSIAFHKGVMLVACFGMFSAREGWRKAIEDNGPNNGLILKIDWGQDIYRNGLNQPHSLTVHEGKLFFCNSGSSQVLQGQNSWTFERYVRGLCKVDGGWIVGESAYRHEEDKEKKDACLVLCDDDFNEIKRVVVPEAKEIYGILPC